MSRPDWNRPGFAEQRLTCVRGGDIDPGHNAEQRRSRSDINTPGSHIQPRSLRHRAINIVSYPSGYVPNDVKADLANCKRAAKARRKRNNTNVTGHTTEGGATSSPSRRAIDKVLASFKSSTLSQIRTSIFPSTSEPPSPIDTTTLSPQTVHPSSMLSLPLPGAPPMASALISESRRALVASTALHNGHWNSVLSSRSAKGAMSSVVEVPKPVASGHGVQCSIILAEPTLFLTGFEHDGHPQQDDNSSTALLRGKLQLDVTKNIKLRAVAIKLHGKARTEWPEGIPPMGVELSEEISLRTQVLTFFHAMHETWETEFGNQCSYSLQQDTANKSSPIHVASTISALKRRSSSHPSSRDARRLSLQPSPSHSFGKSDSPSAEAVQPRTYKMFQPGRYEYSFELPIDHHQLETIRLPYASVKWELEAVVERVGAFKPNLHGTKEISIVRVPDQLSLETVDPISISRQWEDQLHYDIVISGKSFPLGTQIPIAFKLTPLAKVQVHKIKVFATESVEYWTTDRKVTRKDPARKILLFEKTAGKPLEKRYETSEMRILSGGELSPDQRCEARATAQRRRGLDATLHHTFPEPLPEPSENMLGDLDLGLESYWGPTEMEMNVQLPTCEQMAKDRSVRLHPDCSWKNVNVHHWVKIVMRISRLDPEDPTGKRRRHFEISIDSPFTILDCRATQSNTALPQYSSPELPAYQQACCSCPVSEMHAGNTSPTSSTASIPGPVPYANLESGVTNDSPPAFDADCPPPRMPTPPPQYDTVVGTPSVDGLADYFARLADYDGDSDSTEEHVSFPYRLTERSGRVNVPHPRTPNGLLVPSRSLEIQRPPLDTFHMAGALQQRRG